MRENIKNIIIVISITSIWLLIAMFNWISPSQETSLSERRKLEQLPELHVQSVLNGKFMEAFEEYAQDQFPHRLKFRNLKAFTRFYLMAQKDNNHIYIEKGYAAKLDYPLNQRSVKSATDKFQSLYDNYMKDKKVNIFLAVVPDKGYFLAKQNGYPSMDYELLFDLVKNNTEFAQYIDISDILTLEDYYKTDIHWRQEKLLKVAKKISESLGNSEMFTSNYQRIEADVPFYGVYYGQSALPLKPDTLTYLTNNMIESCTVYNVETDSITPVYNIDKMHEKDPYDVYLSGASPLLIIDNPKAKSDKELIVFRDSFGSSLVPLLLEGYSKVTMVDIRYISSDYLEDYIDFNSQDVIFLYSTPILNASTSLK